MRCILHSPNPNKSASEFEVALAELVDDSLRQTVSVRVSGDRDVVQERRAMPVDVSGVVFPALASIQELHRASGLILDRALLLGDFELLGADYPLGLTTRGTSFKGDVRCIECRFSSIQADAVDFDTDVTFQDCAIDTAWFTGGATFRGDTFFSFSTLGGALFQRAIFTARADFTEVTVRESVEFEGCSLGPDMCWGGADLEGALSFRDCSVTGDLSLAGSRVGVRLNVENLQHEGYVDLRRIRIGPDGQVVLLRLEMKDVLMAGTAIGKFDFQVVSWPEVATAASKRRAVADEMRFPVPEEQGLVYGTTQFGETSVEQIELLYRELKRAFDDRADYETAGHFHVGEFEMKLKSSRLPRSTRLLISAYRMLSFYGERWVRPIVLLGLWLLGFTIAMILAGYEVAGRTVDYGFRGIFDPIGLLRDAWITFLYGVQLATAMRPTDVTARFWFSRTLVVTTHVVGPTLVALFILALRRQTKR